MGKAQSKSKKCGSGEPQKAKDTSEEMGVGKTLALIRQLRDFKIAVAGGCGVGKSSFINAFRGYASLSIFVSN